MLGGQREDMEHGRADIPDPFLQCFAPDIFIGDPNRDRSLFFVEFDVQLLAFAPHEVEHALNRLERRHFCKKVSNNKLFLELRSSLKYFVRNYDLRDTRVRVR